MSSLHILEPVIEAGAVAQDAAPPRDPDLSFFEWLADADDPLQTRPAPSANPPEPVAEAEPAPAEEPPIEPQPKRSHSEHDEEPDFATGIVIWIVSAVAFVLIAGLAGASYLAYSYLSTERSEDERPTASNAVDGSSEADHIAAIAKVKAATALVRTQYPDGQSTTSNAFFVPGPGLVVTNARSVGLGKTPVAASKIHVATGNRSLAARILGFNAELDLALLQVSALDLPEPLSLGADTFTVREPQRVIAFSVPITGEAKAISTNSSIVGTRSVSGTRPWFLLGGWLPQGVWGAPVADASGRVIGVAGVIPGSDAVAAVPAETVLAFVHDTLRSVEENGPVVLAAPEAKKKTPEFEEPPNPFRNGRRPGGAAGGGVRPLVPPGFNPQNPFQGPGFIIPPGFPPQPNMPVPMMPPGFNRQPPGGAVQPKLGLPSTRN